MRRPAILQKLKTEFYNDREKLQGKTLAQKLRYYFMYYKVPFIIILAVVLIIISVCHARSNNLDMAFHAYFINAENTISDEIFENDLAEIYQIDTEKEQVLIDSSMYFGGSSMTAVSSTEKFASEINTSLLDACVMPEEYFLTYAREGAFDDLSNYLSDETMTAYADRLVYNDGIAVGICVKDFPAIQKASLYSPEENPVLGVIYNTQNPNKIQAFVDYLAESSR